MEKALDKTLYNKFIDSLELLEEFIPEFSWKRHIAEIDPEKKINLDISLETIKPEIFENTFITGNTLKLKGLDFDKNLQFEITITINLRIASNEKIDEDCIIFYAENTVQLTTVPAFRSLVKEALIKMGLPPFTLPFLKRKSAIKDKQIKFNENKFKELINKLSCLPKNSNGYFEIYTKSQKQLNLVKIENYKIFVATKKDWNKFNNIQREMIETTYNTLIEKGRLSQKDISQGLNIKRSTFIITALELLPEIEYDLASNSLVFIK
jgi:hypothetical protein